MFQKPRKSIMHRLNFDKQTPKFSAVRVHRDTAI